MTGDSDKRFGMEKAGGTVRYRSNVSIGSLSILLYDTLRPPSDRGGRCSLF